MDDLRIFLSSTFTDMRKEREYLIKKVFPEIRRLCRERGVTFTEVDLRWGITEREARRHKIVELCLEEIGRHKPLVISLIGDRYGWCPEERDIGTIREVKTRYPWLPEAVVHRRSLTELESLTAPLNDPEMKDRVRFYFKYKTEPKRTNDSPELLKDREALTGFRQRIHDAGLPCREGYRTPEQLGEWVREDLIALIDEIAPEFGSHDSWLERERRGHEAFAVSRRRAYIEHEPTLRALDDYIEGTRGREKKKKGAAEPRSLPLVVTGESGSGKSSLLAWWGKRRRENNPKEFVIEHYIGATPGSGDRFGLLRRVMVEIRERYGIAEEPPLEPAAIAEQFPAWLARTGEDRVIIILDALNQLTSTDHLDWLPLDFHPNVRVILSTLPGPLLDVCTARKWQIVKVHMLGERERRRAVRTYFDRFGKRLEREQTERIASNSRTTNPLYLRTSLEELRLFGEYDKLDDRINHYLAAENLEELYQRILERMEADFGKGLTRQVMVLIWAARDGLSPEELRGIIGKPTPQLNRFLSAFEFHLLRRDGLYRFHHDYLRGAVERRYLKSRQGKRSAHRAVAVWFSGQSPSERRAVEELWGWNAAKEMAELGAALTLPELFSLMNTEEHRFILLGFWRAAREAGTLPEGKELVSLLIPKRLKGKDRALRLTDVARFLRVAGEYHAATELMARAAAIVEKLPDEKKMLTETLGLLGSCRIEAGDFRGAEKNLKRSMELAGTLHGKNSLDYARTLEEFGTFCYQTREYKGAEKVLTKALRLRERLQGKGHPDTAATTGMLGAAYYGQARFEEAEKNFRYELEILKRNAATATDIGVATCINNLATLLTQAEKYEEAVASFRQVLAMYEQIYGPNHPNTGLILTNLSIPLQRLGLIDEAERVLRRAIAIDESILGKTHPSIAIKLESLGTLILRNDPQKAESYYRESNQIFATQFNKHHLRIVQSWLNIASALRLQEGRQSEALILYCHFLPLKSKALGEENVSYQHSHKIYQDLLSSNPNLLEECLPHDSPSQ